MAKKGQTIQFQTELNTEDEWEKFLEREGLLIIDVYSEWAGPCSSMAPNLKKIKLDAGGDLLQMAIAKCDNIETLKRFRGKSEPTWLFVVGGKMVGITFGANAPELNKFIITEIKKEEACLKGERERVQYEFDELIGEERERWEVQQEKVRAAEAIAKAKRDKEILEWRTTVADNCLENFPEFACVILFPHCRAEAKPLVVDSLQQNGLNLVREEITQITETILEEILYFSDTKFEEEEIEVLLKNPSSALLLKPGTSELSGPIDEVALLAVYGPSKEPPGGPESPAFQFYVPLPPPPKEKKEVGVLGGLPDFPLGIPGLSLFDNAEEPAVEEEEVEEEEEEKGPPITGIWAPPNSYTRAFIIKNCFPKIHAPIALEEPQPTPPHVAIVFDAFRRREILGLVETYQDDVLRYGFFTSEYPEKATLIAKNLRKFEQALAKGVPTYEEKLVLQLSRKRSEAVLAFISNNPIRVSNNVADGEEECKIFFPEDYDEVFEEEIIEEEKPKKKKKKGKPKEEGAVEEDKDEDATEKEEEGEEEGQAEGDEEGEQVPATEEVPAVVEEVPTQPPPPPPSAPPQPPQEETPAAVPEQEAA